MAQSTQCLLSATLCRQGSGFDLWHPGAFLSFQNSRGEGGWGRGEILQGHPSTTYLGQSGIATTKIKEGCFIVSFMIV